MSEGGPARRILLLDCDMFFVQVARLEDPDGAAAEPLLIVGGSASGRGVVTSADYRVREYGVRSGMPTARALRLCPRATVVPVPRGACVERSRAIRAVLTEASPVVQAASIDEFYLDLTGTERLYRGEGLLATASRIRKRVLDETGISVSVGGGTTRLVAKLAVERAKPGGIHLVSAGQEAEFLRGHELSRIPGIGPVLIEKLRERGLVTVEDLLPVEEAWLRRWFGPARGRWLRDRIRGIDPSPVDPDEGRKSVSSERTFARDIASDRELERQLQRLCTEVGSTLRRKGLRARTVTVKLRDSDFTTRQASRTLPEAIESDRAIFRTARDLLGELRCRRRAPARLLGVGTSSLEEGSGPRQLSLLEREAGGETERDRTLARAADRLRERFGRDALLPGRALDTPTNGDGPDTDGEETP